MTNGSRQFADDPAALILHYESRGAISMPLTADQHQTLYGGLLPDINWLPVFLLYTLEEHVDVDIMRRSVKYVFDYHESLSTRVINDEGVWREFIVCDENAYWFRSVDHSGLDSQARHRALETLLRETTAKLDISRGPVAAVVFIDRGRRMPPQMLCVLHHIVLDAISVRILLDDIVRVYGQLAEKGVARLPPKTMHLQTWAMKLHEYANSRELRGEVDYWKGLPWHRVPALPTDYRLDMEKNVAESLQGVERALDIEETESLMIDFVRGEGISAPDLVIAALVIAICPWAGGEWLSLGVHDAGRNVVPGVSHADLSRTVGWLAYQRLILLRYPGAVQSANPLEAVRAIHKQINAMPNKALGYRLLRNCCEDEEVRKALTEIPAPQLLFNYVGMMAEFADAGPWHREDPEDGLLYRLGTHPRHKYNELLLCSALISQGRFKLCVAYSENVFYRSTVERLVDGAMATVRGVLQPYNLRAAQAGAE